MENDRTNRYERIWRNKWLADGATDIEQMSLMLKSSAKELEEINKSPSFRVLFTNTLGKMGIAFHSDI